MIFHFLIIGILLPEELPGSYLWCKTERLNKNKLVRGRVGGKYYD